MTICFLYWWCSTSEILLQIILFTFTNFNWVIAFYTMNCTTPEKGMCIQTKGKQKTYQFQSSQVISFYLWKYFQVRPHVKSRNPVTQNPFFCSEGHLEYSWMLCSTNYFNSLIACCSMSLRTQQSHLVTKMKNVKYKIQKYKFF